MKVLKEFSFKDPVAKAKHPWSEWATTGKIIQLEKGTDFDAKPGSIGQQARSYAKRHGLSVRVSVSETAVVLQFTPKPAEDAQPVTETTESPKQKRKKK